MSKILTYKVISDCHLSDLVKKVNKSLAEGWEPLGGISSFVDVGYLQAMVYKDLTK